MDNLSKFAETLDSLMFEQKITATQLAAAIGLDLATISRALHAQYTPSVNTLLKLADFFNCTTDYLLGREPENYPSAFLPCPPFAEQLVRLKERFNCPWCHFYKHAQISASRFYEWKSGSREPTLNGIIALADGFDVTVDYILGRVKN
ncbi:helix-turn-helix domain-containing protein [Pumilibacter muris]|uniref:helix-turn-helix domain-containing protein n=1 Tax=Pumilibacter muris TaxID=2941510 RepID=UPI0020419E18|nr:helix-turn-helix transcriptional regulator [Pumilibacter muris]MCX4313823.1 helix-turn-helix transcriptional regulator [Clostridia bacterium]